MTWSWEYALKIFPNILEAGLVTLQATMAGTALAVVAGLVFALLRRSPRWLVRKPAQSLVEFFRSTPLLVQIYFLYYVFPEFGIKMTPFATGTIALGIHFGSYMSEVYRSGIEGIPRGQWEAALALDLSKFRLYRDVILPQALPPVIPALGNYVIAMFKETPQLSAITVLEMLQVAKIIGSEEFRYLEPVTIVGILFLGISLVAAYGIKAMEKKLPPEGIPLR